jgi:hypothetical protein
MKTPNVPDDYVYVETEGNYALNVDDGNGQFDLTMDDLVLNGSDDSLQSRSSSTRTSKQHDDDLQEVILYVQKNSRMKLVVLAAYDAENLNKFNFDSTIKLVSATVSIQTARILH